MKVIVDDKIPFIRPSIEKLADEVQFLPGAEITAEDVKDADVLIVRTRTRCNRELLHGSRVRFIATATIGYDHLDTDYLRRAGIFWTNCPGCNASSVGQYVENSMLVLAEELGIDLEAATVGIVGVGHVGSNVHRRLMALGMRCLLCDPPRAEREGNADGRFHTLEELQQRCHIITFHTPLVTDGPWPTLHMADRDFFARLPHRPVILNTSRGEVVDNAALEEALDRGLIRQAIIDTWENEPHLRLSLLRKVLIGTPHIAGYSADGKANATRMVLQALCRWMDRPADFHIALPHCRPTSAPSPILPPSPSSSMTPAPTASA